MGKGWGVVDGEGAGRYFAPAVWVPACAGMTGRGARNDGEGRGESGAEGREVVVAAEVVGLLE